MIQINNDILYDFIHCHYKVFLKSNNQEGVCSEFTNLTNQIKKSQLIQFEKHLLHSNKLNRDNLSFANGTFREDTFINVQLGNSNFDIRLDGIEVSDKKQITSIFLTPNEKHSKNDKLFLSLQSFLIQSEFKIAVEYCKIIFGKSFHQSKFKLSASIKTTKKIIEELKQMLHNNQEPEHILNNHCAICEYSTYCREKALASGNISLLDRATTKVVEKYKKKGIFTIQQLSYIYKPRRKRKQRNRTIHAHNFELQALAIRTQKTYIQQLPELLRHPVEIFLDIEGIPDRDEYYLIGILLLKNQETTYLNFWAGDSMEEIVNWKQFVSAILSLPEVPIYHYGHYDSKAIDTLGERYSTNVAEFKHRLINVNQLIYGKIYFPVYSNRLKELGKFVGAKWSAMDASGIMSSIWRNQWEEIKDEKLKEKLLTYNFEDCLGLKLLTDKLTEIKELANISADIDFVNNPKQISTQKSSQIHQQFSNLLKFAHSDYDKSKISFQSPELAEDAKNNVGGRKGHKGTHRLIPKARKIITVPRKRICPKDNVKLQESSRGKTSTTQTELIFTKNGIRKTVIKYTGYKGYCNKCKTDYSPPYLLKIRHQHFGHNFKSWIVYQRLFLRLPLDVIKTNLKELFNEHISQSTVAGTMADFSKYYSYTNHKNLVAILQSPFIHVDETQVNVKGVNQYVWILTDGNHVFFRISPTREIKMIQELLGKYEGILISDFYTAYDSLKCGHQKCWSHLIRDLNDDLWKYPYDIEYETFVKEFKDIIIPIFQTVEKFGLKKYHFHKHLKTVQGFYEKNLHDSEYHSEITLKYQKRLKKYWVHLFTFLENDNIPWNNNAAERGLRHLAVQRKISMSFSNGIHNYLLFLGIMQTCIFQNKSFLKFLLSGKKNIY